MKIDFEKVWLAANARYAAEKLRKAGYTQSSMSYLAPEMIPQINSDQVKCMLEALVEEINDQSKPNILGPRPGISPL